MSYRTKSISTVLAAVVVAGALVLSAVGGAGAAALTPKVVKKIATKAATKVVKKQAPKLSVAHAATADNANALGGLSAGQLQTTEYRYTITPLAPNGVIVYHFPGLPSGSYQVSYWYSANTAPTAQLSCEITASAVDDPVAQSFSETNSSGKARASATGGLTTTTGPVTFACIPTGGTIVMFGQVSFVRVDTVVPGATTAG